MSVAALDLLKVADYAILVHAIGRDSGTVEGGPLLTEEAEKTIEFIKCQGVPSPVFVVQGIANVPQKRVGAVKAALRDAIQFHLTESSKPFQMDSIQVCVSTSKST